MGPDQSESATEKTNQAGQIEREKTAAVQPTPSTPAASEYSETSGFDVMALDVVILLAAFFAITARLNAQPSNSLTPAAILSATGCGLLITALRKRHTFQRPGLLEAGLGGLILAFFQFIAAITYPNVIITLGLDEGQRLGFIATCRGRRSPGTPGFRASSPLAHQAGGATFIVACRTFATCALVHQLSYRCPAAWAGSYSGRLYLHRRL